MDRTMSIIYLVVRDVDYEDTDVLCAKSTRDKALEYLKKISDYFKLDRECDWDTNDRFEYAGVTYYIQSWKIDTEEADHIWQS